MTKNVGKISVGIVMGSTSDWDVMKHAAQQLKDFGIGYDARALSAHRSPDLLFEWIEECEKNGVQCFVAGAGGAAQAERERRSQALEALTGEFDQVVSRVLGSVSSAVAQMESTAQAMSGTASRTAPDARISTPRTLLAPSRRDARLTLSPRIE